jgi:hypothetical protein
MKEKFYIIDATSPFFVKHPRTRINWSKVPYHNLERNGKVHKKTYNKIRGYFSRYIKKISAIGYNAISIDDLSHLVVLKNYPPQLKKKIHAYQKHFKRMFAIARRYNLKIFVTTDIMFYNRWIEAITGNKDHRIRRLLVKACGTFFRMFDEVDGIIFRVGESDGVDVKGEFISRLVLKSPGQVRKYLKELIPIFEFYNKICIFRTWTTGAYRIGDLMWNEWTFKNTFGRIKSDNLIISLKYGDSDFFRKLDLNPLFFCTSHRKIIELQTRREYEGFGEFPSFVGWDYKAFSDRLCDEPIFSGISVWCQTGGWSSFRNFTFLKKTSHWNELNTYVTLKVFKERLSVQESLKSFYKERNVDMIAQFLTLANEVITDILYDPQFSNQAFYFNRLRIPPIFHIFWDTVTVTSAIITFYNVFNRDPQDSINCAYEALPKLKKMTALARETNLPYNDKFQSRTFEIIALCRELIYSDAKKSVLKRLKLMIKKYHEKYPMAYRFYVNIGSRFNSRTARAIIKLGVRRRKKYRMLDRLLFNHFTAPLYILAFKLFRRNFPDFVDKQAMPIETFFK